MERECLCCGKKFETKAKGKKYCSVGCYVFGNPEKFPDPQIAIMGLTGKPKPAEVL